MHVTMNQMYRPRPARPLFANLSPRQLGAGLRIWLTSGAHCEPVRAEVAIHYLFACGLRREPELPH